jgi:hypothetical protein
VSVLGFFELSERLVSQIALRAAVALGPLWTPIAECSVDCAICGDELIYLPANEFVLFHCQSDASLEVFNLPQQVEVILVLPVIDPALVVNVLLRLGDEAFNLAALVSGLFDALSFLIDLHLKLTTLKEYLLRILVLVVQVLGKCSLVTLNAVDRCIKFVELVFVSLHFEVKVGQFFLPHLMLVHDVVQFVLLFLLLGKLVLEGVVNVPQLLLRLRTVLFYRLVL